MKLFGPLLNIMQDATGVCWLLLNLIAFAQSSTTPIDKQGGTAKVSVTSAGHFNWIGREVRGASRNNSGCGKLPCKDLTDGLPLTNAGIWGTSDKPVVSSEVYEWALNLAKRHIQTASSNSSGPLRKGKLEEVFERMALSTEPFRPANRLLHVKVVGGKVYVIGTSALDHEPSSNMMSYWSTGLLRGILKILERNKDMPDWEAIFTCTPNSNDIIQSFKPGIPVFTHCAAGVNAKYGVAIPIPRPYAMWRLHKARPKIRALWEIQQILYDKYPRAVFRGSLSGPWRINLFQLANRPQSAEFIDVGMTVVPPGAPCEDKAGWCTGKNGPSTWVEKYELKKGEFMKPSEQMNFRYIIMVDGVGCPDRLSTHPEFNLASDSVVLWRRSALSEFWFPDLKPWVHYIPIKDNFADVVQLVEKYNDRLDVLARIVLNAQEYVRSWQQPGIWLQYLREVLIMYAAAYMDYKIEVPSHAVQVVLTGEGAVSTAG